MKITTSDLRSVPADIRINLSRKHPLRFRRLFLGLHLDFSTHQILAYFGLFTLFMEIYGPYKKDAVIDMERVLCKFKNLKLCFHNSNYSKHFFNIGVTFESNHLTLFFWQLRFYIFYSRNES